MATLAEVMDKITADLVAKGFKTEDVKAARISLAMQYKDELDRRKVLHDILRCDWCDLRQGDIRGPIPGVGPADTPLMFVGEGPGANEDAMGMALTGISGQFFTIILNKAGVDRSKVWLTNVIKCRPEGNRTPTPDECNTCGAHLLNEISYVKPKVIVTMGNPATKFLLDEPDLKITQARGQWVEKHGIWIMPTVHPQYILRKTGAEMQTLKAQIWLDISNAVNKAKELAPDYKFTR